MAIFQQLPIYVILLCATAAQKLTEGSSCKLEATGEDGTCLHLKHCNEVYQAILNDSEPQPQICDMDGTVPIVCCVRPSEVYRDRGADLETESSERRSTTRSSEQHSTLESQSSFDSFIHISAIPVIIVLSVIILICLAVIIFCILKSKRYCNYQRTVVTTLPINRNPPEIPAYNQHTFNGSEQRTMLPVPEHSDKVEPGFWQRITVPRSIRNIFRRTPRITVVSRPIPA